MNSPPHASPPALGAPPGSDWLGRIAALSATDGLVARITIIEAEGPTPREVGAAILVTINTAEGKIGRGRLEQRAIEAARRMIAEAAVGPAVQWHREVVTCETGPVLGASSGGRIGLLIEVFGAAEVATFSAMPTGRSIVIRSVASGQPLLVCGDDDTDDSAGLPAQVATALTTMQHDPSCSQLLVEASDRLAPRWLLERIAPRHVALYVYGTGLVARALVRVLAGLPFEVVWVDTDPPHFPADAAVQVPKVAVADPAEFARAAAPGSFHVVMTVSHEIDHAVCRALLAANVFGFAGVIGSRMKRKRLLARLAEDGIAAPVLDRLVCPVGLAGIKSKAPAVIAVSIAAQALLARGAA